jgi:hypothetical protein
VLNLLKFLDARFGEPSTYASIAVLLAASGAHIDNATMHTIAMYGVVVASAFGVLLSEAGAKPAAQVAADVLKATVAGVKAMPVAALALMLAGAGALSACGTPTQGAAVLTAAGVPAATAQTITSDAAAAGQLFCQSESGVVAVAGANVVGATGAAVSAVCAAASATGALTPVAPPTGTVAKVVAVTPVVIAALEASKSLAQ